MRIFLAIISLVLSGSVYAQIYTCDVDGNISYQEVPCESVSSPPAMGIQKSVIPAKYIGADTQEPVYANYYKTLLEKIEDVGNKNYPVAAKQERLSGNLLVQFILKPEGNVGDIYIRESSGYDVLDDGAVNIIRMSEPFDRFPRQVLKETSELVVSVRMDFLKPHTLKCRFK